jgi:hypothetical protein
LRTAAGERWSFAAMASTECDDASFMSCLSFFIDHPPRPGLFISSPSAHLQLFQPDFYQDYLQLSGT